MPAPRKSETVEVLVPLDQFATSASIAIPVASLLVRKPELAEAQLTVEQWQAELDADQATETH